MYPPALTNRIGLIYGYILITFLRFQLNPLPYNKIPSYLLNAVLLKFKNSTRGYPALRAGHIFQLSSFH